MSDTIRKLRDANLKNSSPVGTALLDALLSEADEPHHLKDHAPAILPAPFRNPFPRKE